MLLVSDYSLEISLCKYKHTHVCVYLCVCVVFVFLFLFYTKGSTMYMMFGILVFYLAVCLIGLCSSIVEYFLFFKGLYNIFAGVLHNVPFG